MEIENVTALLKQHVYEQVLEAKEPDVLPIRDETANLSGHVWEDAPPRPWTAREPLSPPTMGYPLPYLDVMTVQSKRLLPVTRKELEAQRQRAFLAPDRVTTHDIGNGEQPAVDDESNGKDENDQEDEDRGTEPVDAIGGAHVSLAKSNDFSTVGKMAPLDFDAILRSVRLLMEPIAIPDLSHTGVKWQFAQGLAKSDAELPKLCVTVPNHSFDETQVKLFYATGAKNTNMREYIKDTIQKHMAGFVDPHGSPAKSIPDQQLTASQSMPVLQADERTPVEAAHTISSPDHKKSKLKTKSHKTSSHGSPSQTSPQKRSGVSSGARLSGSVSTSGLLNPELTRQTKDILAQLRANAYKMNDLIGS